MRQTGRTSRIITFVVDQLFSVGECIAADHTIFEYEKVPHTAIKYFIERVEREFNFHSLGRHELRWKIIDVDGRKLVHFTRKMKTD